MLTQLNAENFKSWQNIGEMGLASVTGLFGTNSSGKTSILQLILMLKQTIESANRKQIIDFGSEDSYVNLENYRDIIYNHEGMRNLNIALTWELAKPIEVYNSALLANRLINNQGQRLEEKVAYWLRELKIIEDFSLIERGDNNQAYKLLVKKTSDAPEVLITDIGFGVSQILPVLVLCYYVPEGSTILLEQPEIHLHPSVQAGLADVFIDAVKTRNVQIILESHSEHLLRRLQRRIAEEKQKFSERDTALYFCQTTADGTSELLPLELDTFGNINNWPSGFFGDEMGDLVAMTEAGLKRQMEV